MNQKMRVLGYRFFNDTVEGQKYDFTKLRVEMPVPRNSKSEVGNNVVEVTWGDSANAEKLKGLTFPLEALLDVEMTTKGLDCFDFKPAQASQVKAA